MHYSSRCLWCRARNASCGIPFHLAADARRAHKQHQIELKQPVDKPSGDVAVCTACGEAVRKAILDVYLARRKFSPDNVEQIEDLEARVNEVEQEKKRQQEQSEAREKELQQQLRETKHALGQKTKQLDITTETLQRVIDLPKQMAADIEFHAKNAVEGELEPDDILKDAQGDAEREMQRVSNLLTHD